MRYLLLLTLVILSGCSVTQAVKSEYRISANIPTQEYSSQLCREKSLKVRQVFSPSSMMSQKMKYVEGEFREYTFTESEWAQSPNKAIGNELLKSVRKSQLFKSVQNYKTRSKNDLILETNIEEFIQYFSSDSKTSHVNLTLVMTLIDTKSAKVIDTLSVSEKIDVKSINAEGGVSALNAALSQVLTSTNEWLNVVCK